MKQLSTKAERGTAHTTALVQASPANDAEFVDSPGAKIRFGLGRSLLYQLHGEGLIEGVSLRRRGALKGKRLWGVDSIRFTVRRLQRALTQSQFAFTGPSEPMPVSVRPYRCSRPS